MVSLSFCLHMKTCTYISMVRLEVCGKHIHNMKWAIELCIYQTSEPFVGFTYSTFASWISGEMVAHAIVCNYRHR